MPVRRGTRRDERIAARARAEERREKPPVGKKSTKDAGQREGRGRGTTERKGGTREEARRKERTVCVHAAHVACQPAWWTPFGPLPLPPLARVKVRPRSSLSLSLLPILLFSFFPFYRSFFLFPPRSPFLSTFFPFFLRKRAQRYDGEKKKRERERGNERAAGEEEGIFLFIKLQPLTWSTPTHGPTCGWTSIATGERLPRTLLSVRLKARIARREFSRAGHRVESDRQPVERPIKESIVRYLIHLLRRMGNATLLPIVYPSVYLES